MMWKSRASALRKAGRCDWPAPAPADRAGMCHGLRRFSLVSVRRQFLPVLGRVDPPELPLLIAGPPHATASLEKEHDRPGPVHAS